MNTFTGKLIITGILFLFTLISGVAISHTGKPYNSAIFAIHKLSALGGIVLVAITAVRLYKTGNAIVFIDLGMVILSGLLFLSLVVSGGLLSVDLQLPQAVLKVHQIVPLLSLASSAATIFLLWNRLNIVS